MLTLTLPYPPSVNNYWRSRIAGAKKKQFVSVYVTPEGVTYRKNVVAAVLKQNGCRRLTGRLRVQIALEAPDRRGRDLDNALKATLDALTCAAVWVDDKQIDDLRIVRGPVTSPGSLVVSIEEIPEPQGRLFDGQ